MCGMTRPVKAAAPCIQLSSMPQLVEARSQRDDWTGTNNAAARRKAQTRLNTRAYRRRKALEMQAKTSSATTDTIMNPETPVTCWDVEQRSISIVPASRIDELYNSKDPLLSVKNNEEKSKTIFPLSTDHLITLLQFNVLRAMSVNRSLITGILFNPTDCSEEVIHIVPYPSRPELLPPSLLPTILQQTIPHGDWIDSFPCAEGRDRLILAAGTFDEDELWADCIGGLYEGFPDDEVERRGVIAWSPPWDITGWEMSEGFLKKWSWILKGVPGVLEATNRWRVERNEEPFTDHDWTSGTCI